jgi:copper(I)-binding protein
MRLESLALPLAALLLVSCKEAPSKFAITDVHAVATGKMASAYFTLGNSGGADRLVRVETADTGSASLHDMNMEGGIMRMRPAPDGFPIPAGEGLILAPQGRHVMVMADKDIEVGGTMPMVLYFERHRPMALAVPVEAPGQNDEDDQ